MARFARGHYDDVAAVIRAMNAKASEIAYASDARASGYRQATSDCTDMFVKLFKEESPSFDVVKFLATTGGK